jgi:hypothetical protein
MYKNTANQHPLFFILKVFKKAAVLAAFIV